MGFGMEMTGCRRHVYPISDQTTAAQPKDPKAAEFMLSTRLGVVY